MAEISDGCQVQAASYGEVSQGLVQVGAVALKNTASAEECAASAEQLSSHAQQLYRLLNRFRISADPAQEQQAGSGIPRVEINQNRT